MFTYICGNIYQTVYKDELFAYFNQLPPDIELLCLQEVPECSLPWIARLGFVHQTFIPVTKIKRGPNRPYHSGLSGQLIASKVPVNVTIMPIGGSMDHVTDFVPGEYLATYLLKTSYRSYNLLSTHFVWAPDTLPTQRQITALDCLISLLPEAGLLAGDFNFPHEGVLANTIPWDDTTPEGDTSLDPKLHRVPNLKVKCDLVFYNGVPKPSVTYRFGYSDHALMEVTCGE